MQQGVVTVIGVKAHQHPVNNTHPLHNVAFKKN